MMHNEHSRIGKGNLGTNVKIFRSHYDIISVLHFVPNSQGIACGVAKRTRFASLPEYERVQNYILY